MGKKCGLGRVRRGRRKDGGKGEMCGLGKDGLWGVGEVTYMFFINFLAQI